MPGPQHISQAIRFNLFLKTGKWLAILVECVIIVLMLVLICFAFVAGVFTVLSPCILPVLPILLSAGTGQGKLRPLGITTGLMISFSFFTLALTALVQMFGLSAGILRDVAIALIVMFGVMMVFPKLSDWFAKKTTFISSFGRKLQPSGQVSGFWGGVVLGGALGLVWTPCAGPILATIASLVATQSISGTAVFMTLCYSLGAGIPLFLITYGSNRMVQSSKLLSKHSGSIRRVFGGVMIAFGLIMVLNWDVRLGQKLSQIMPSGLVESNTRLEQELQKLRGTEQQGELTGKAPELTGIDHWLNSSPLTMEALKGKVVLLDFWSYTCINCLKNLPHLEKWNKTYGEKGLVVIAIHIPEFEHEKEISYVQKALTQLGVTIPCALDNNYKIWLSYKNNYTPTMYLIDKEGNISKVLVGNSPLEEIEKEIERLLSL